MLIINIYFLININNVNYWDINNNFNDRYNTSFLDKWQNVPDLDDDASVVAYLLQQLY